MEQWEMLGKILDKLEKPKEVTLKNHKDFEDFLAEKFALDNPLVLDDDWPDAYEYWLSDLEPDTFIKWANEYGKSKEGVTYERSKNSAL